MRTRLITALIAAGCILALAAAPAHATITLDSGLGLADHPWMVDGLQSYIYANPSYLGQFRNTIFFERIGANAGDNVGGFIWNPAKKLTLGVFSGLAADDGTWNTTGAAGLYYMGNYTPRSLMNPTLVKPGPTILDLDDPDGNGAGATPYRKFLANKDVIALLSYEFSRWTLGFSLGYATAWNGETYDNTTGTQKDEYQFSSTQYNVGLSVLFRINERMTLDTVLGFTMYDLANTYDMTAAASARTMSYESDGAMDIGGTMRYNWQATRMQKLHIQAGFTSLNRSTKGSDVITGAGPVNASDTYGRTGMEINFGVADEMRLTGDFMAYIGMNVNYLAMDYSFTGTQTVAPSSDSTYTNKASAFSIPILLGLETRLSEGWSLRFGFSHIIYNPATSEDSSAHDSTASDITRTINGDDSATTKLNLGLSYKYGNLRLDWLANVDLFVRGPEFVSGNATAQSLSGNDGSTPVSLAFALTYSFDSLLSQIAADQAEPEKAGKKDEGADKKE
ncbi:MAG: hypothetical protein EPN93_20325 [Spirochaetes bacterium]|nr:MAG: hypothetical protein EPN93_20325 [Spirochaetota bacterium]